MDGRDSVYTTQTLLKAEVALAETLERLSTAQNHPVSSVVLGEVLKSFGEADGVTSSVSVQVQEAIHHVTLGHQVSCLVGAAGTGKTSVIAKAQRIWEDSGYRVMGLAPTGRAARNLQEVGVFSQTIHRLLGDLASGRQQVSSKTVWVVDEAGMVDTLKFRELFAWAETLGVKVVLLGDSAQLQPVGAGAFFRWATVLRQRASWQREATQLFAFGRTEEAIQAYHQAGKLKLVEFSRQDAREALLSAWSEALGAHPQETLLMLAHSNQDVEALNQGARHLLQQLGKVSISECSLMVQQMRVDGLGNGEVVHQVRSFSVGDRIRFTRNDRGLGVQNGLLGTVEAVSKQAMRVRVSDPSTGDAGRLVSFSPKLYPYLDHGWALTVHQSQGVTIDKTFVLASPGFSRNLAYVALSRHREDVQVFGAFCEFKTHENLMASLSKMSEKLGALDYVEPEAASALQEPPSGALEAALEKLWRQLDAIQFVTLEA